MTEALMCHGGGANGKTTVMAAVARVLGNYTAKLPNGFIAEPKGDKHPTDMTLLCGARFAIASETKLTDRLDEAKMKAILGDGTISARRMNEDFWDFKPTHNLAICVNHLPKISGQDDGIWRRFRFINWPYQVPEGQRIENFDEVLFREEGSGILNWLLEGLAGFKSEGMRPPASVMADTAKARENANWAAQFVAGYTAFEEDMTTPLDTNLHRLKLADVYEKYVHKTRSEGEVVLTSRLATPAICEAFEAIGVKCVRVQGSWRAMGVRMKTDKDYENELDYAMKNAAQAGSLGGDDDDRWAFAQGGVDRF
jgi:P4 family phage/plasmid primase-like protien